MTLEEYLAFTADYAYYPSANKGNLEEVTYLALGLAGEAGESVDVIKKLMRGDFYSPDADLHHDLDVEMREKLALELGDVLWYWVRLVWWVGLTPEQIIHMNYHKLNARTAERAKAVAQPFPPPKVCTSFECLTCGESTAPTAGGRLCDNGHFTETT